MAFSATGLTLMMQVSGPIGAKVWVYDTIDVTGDVDATDYFAGMAHPASTSVGMEVGDMVLVRIWTTSIPASTAAKQAANPADAGWYMIRAVDSDGNATAAAETAIVVAAGA